MRTRVLWIALLLEIGWTYRDAQLYQNGVSVGDPSLATTSPHWSVDHQKCIRQHARPSEMYIFDSCKPGRELHGEACVNTRIFEKRFFSLLCMTCICTSLIRLRLPFIGLTCMWILALVQCSWEQGYSCVPLIQDGNKVVALTRKSCLLPVIVPIEFMMLYPTAEACNEYQNDYEKCCGTPIQTLASACGSHHPLFDGYVKEESTDHRLFRCTFLDPIRTQQRSCTYIPPHTLYPLPWETLDTPRGYENVTRWLTALRRIMTLCPGIEAAGTLVSSSNDSASAVNIAHVSVPYGPSDPLSALWKGLQRTVAWAFVLRWTLWYIVHILYYYSPRPSTLLYMARLWKAELQRRREARYAMHCKCCLSPPAYIPLVPDLWKHVVDYAAPTTRKCEDILRRQATPYCRYAISVSWPLVWICLTIGFPCMYIAASNQYPWDTRDGLWMHWQTESQHPLARACVEHGLPFGYDRGPAPMIIMIVVVVILSILFYVSTIRHKWIILGAWLFFALCITDVYVRLTLFRTDECSLGLDTVEELKAAQDIVESTVDSKLERLPVERFVSDRPWLMNVSSVYFYQLVLPVHHNPERQSELPPFNFVFFGWMLVCIVYLYIHPWLTMWAPTFDKMVEPCLRPLDRVLFTTPWPCRCCAIHHGRTDALRYLQCDVRRRIL